MSMTDQLSQWIMQNYPQFLQNQVYSTIIPQITEFIAPRLQQFLDQYKSLTKVFLFSIEPVCLSRTDFLIRFDIKYRSRILTSKIGESLIRFSASPIEIKSRLVVDIDQIYISFDLECFQVIMVNLQNFLTDIVTSLISQITQSSSQPMDANQYPDEQNPNPFTQVTNASPFAQPNNQVSSPLVQNQPEPIMNNLMTPMSTNSNSFQQQPTSSSFSRFPMGNLTPISVPPGNFQFRQQPQKVSPSSMTSHQSSGQSFPNPNQQSGHKSTNQTTEVQKKQPQDVEDVSIPALPSTQSKPEEELPMPLIPSIPSYQKPTSQTPPPNPSQNKNGKKK